MLGVNLGGVVHGVRSFVPGMVARGEPAHVVNTASIGGLVAFPSAGARTRRRSTPSSGCPSASSTTCAQPARPVGVSVLCPGPTLSSLRENSTLLRPGGEDGREVPLVTDLPRTPAAEVAAQVVDAIRTNRFWILTHPAYNETIRERCRGIVDTDAVVVPELV